VEPVLFPFAHGPGRFVPEATPFLCKGENGMSSKLLDVFGLAPSSSAAFVAMPLVFLLSV
jgi:hypothetical protein